MTMFLFLKQTLFYIFQMFLLQEIRSMETESTSLPALDEGTAKQEQEAVEEENQEETLPDEKEYPEQQGNFST